MYLKYLLFVLAVYSGSLKGKELYWVFFNDKGSFIEEGKKPALGSAALERRKLRNIPLGLSDFPVYSPYLYTLQSNGYTIVGHSRWLNAAVLSCTREDLVQLQKFVFIRRLQAMKSAPSFSESEAVEHNLQEIGSDFQLRLMGLTRYQSLGYTGRNVRIGIFDGGFESADTMRTFQPIWQSGRVVKWYSFVSNTRDVFSETMHGTYVWAIIGANSPGKYKGAAPDASFLLAQTEISGSESRQEEYNWVKALEWADSTGVDIIQTSLNYNEFDDPNQNYTYADLNGDISIITRAADMAAAKGILIVNSAGNQGNTPWKYISPPCDGDSVLCVGAIDMQLNLASFSSIGPTSDGRIKPDVVAIGRGTTYIGRGNRLLTGNGTSYSSPLISGLAACLIQAHPERHPMDIIRAIRLSADQSGRPDPEYGYGIPNAIKADRLLRTYKDLTQAPDSILKLPNREELLTRLSMPEDPGFTDKPKTTIRIIANVLSLNTLEAKLKEVVIIFKEERVHLPPTEVKMYETRATFNIAYLLPGEYTLLIQTDQYKEKVKFSKQ